MGAEESTKLLPRGKPGKGVTFPLLRGLGLQIPHRKSAVEVESRDDSGFSRFSAAITSAGSVMTEKIKTLFQGASVANWKEAISAAKKKIERYFHVR